MQPKKILILALSVALLLPLVHAVRVFSSPSANTQSVPTIDENTTLPTSNRTVEIWWPTDSAKLTGAQPIKALLKDAAVTTYQMFWRVDGGQLNLMADDYKDYPHKEAVIDVSGWNWRAGGPYVITVEAHDFASNKLAERSVSIFIEGKAPALMSSTQTVTQEISQASQTTTQTSTAVTQPATQATPTVTQPTTTGAASTGILAGQKLYVNQNSPAKRAADSLRSSQPTKAALLDKIAAQPESAWFGNWNSDIAAAVKARVSDATAQGAVAVLVAYNIPQRDCGGYSAGGSNSPDSYKQWIRNFAAGINGKKAVVVLEPDAIAGADCLSSGDRQTRYALLADATQVLKGAGALVYLDAGHSGWHAPEEMANRLKASGINNTNGFSLNVSNYVTTQSNVEYGTKISRLLNNKHFIVDTSRNGLGPTPDYQWCNPQGRALGNKPTTTTGNELVDAFLWIKVPGESDGNCNGGPSAGQFWTEYAIGLASRAAW